MTVNDVKESLKNSGRHVSMDAPLVEGEDSNLYDVLNSGESPNPDRQLLHESLRTEIERALDTLTPREADVVRLYFGLGNQHAMTLEEIGETFDLTRERVRQIKEKAIRRLKHTSRSKILKTYLSGLVIIKCTSKGFLVIFLIKLTIGIPKEIFGTNKPSITSRWNQSALLLLIISQSLERLPKSAARIEGAILIDIINF
mgnify:CR=1 FL=1